jgi:D-mannonate dehydratase
MKKLWAWVNRNATSICVGWIVALVMATIMIVQGTKYSSKEIDHLMDKIELTKENNELAQTAIEQFGTINDLIKTASTQRDQIEQAVETINEQTAILQRLVDYLRKIGHWPPKIDPPKPVNPDSLARGRSEA